MNTNDTDILEILSVLLSTKHMPEDVAHFLEKTYPSQAAAIVGLYINAFKNERHGTLFLHWMKIAECLDDIEIQFK